MSSLSSLTILTAAEPAGRELPMPPVFFGLISLLLFGLALAFLWSFRNTAAKTDPRNVGDHGAHVGPAAQHGDARVPH